MIEFDRFELDNGLKVVVHRDITTPIAAVNILYNVGAKDENPDKTGFAHLFEHLMFGGSVNIPSFDEPLQKVGGNNNAFTNNDITNYYLTLPVDNIETGFWLESDRMQSLAFTQKSLDVQKHVVIEEYKQRYLNQPYGDIWIKLRPLAYKKHPYRWSTIGKEISHIENATLQDVKNFFYSHYAPNNAILTVAGNIQARQVEKLAKKWFGSIEKRNIKKRNIPPEPAQTEARSITVKNDVPFDMIVKVFHMCERTHNDYHATDLISDILSNGKSSRFNRILVKEKKLFSSVDAYIMGSIEKGLFVVEGTLIKGVDMQKAEEAINVELKRIMENKVEDRELNKVKNKVISTMVFSRMSVLQKAMGLAFYELIGDANAINNEEERYEKVTALQINKTANKLFLPTNCSTLYYYSNK